MDLILQDLDKIDQFHHNYEMMTHGETSRPGFYTGYFSLHEQLSLSFTISIFLEFYIDATMNLVKSRQTRPGQCYVDRFFQETR